MSVPASGRPDRKNMFRGLDSHGENDTSRTDPPELDMDDEKRLPRWNMGMLSCRDTEEVPGSVLLLSKASEYNEPLGYQNLPARTSTSSIPSWSRGPPLSRQASVQSVPRRREQDKKRTADGTIILEPQPDDSLNDPLNWRLWRRDAALFSLGFYCMLGGGMTTVIAAGFDAVATAYHVSVPRVALTTGLYMMGLGLGSVVLSPTAILWGKRPVYLAAALCFVLSAVWCALSPDFPSLICARIFMGFAASSVECLPSASIAEIYFLHEKAYRLGIYTLLLLGGKNLVPLVSAAIIQSLGWRWVFWIVAIVVGFAGCLLFFFVPETFWDRAPTPPRRTPRSRPSFARRLTRSRPASSAAGPAAPPANDPALHTIEKHAHFSTDSDMESKTVDAAPEPQGEPPHVPTQPQMTLPSPTTADHEKASLPSNLADPEHVDPSLPSQPKEPNSYTPMLRSSPPRSYLQQLRPWNGRLCPDPWLRVAVRPFILFAYPSILWSALVYALSVGWLIVLSESVSTIYENRSTYSFSPLQAGLVYISPLVGGVLGTAVAGKLSDLLVRWLARRNGGLYEPEFRLFMGIPIAISTTIGLMGYGWAAQERDAWIVPTVFFGVISFGCCCGSTTAITFAVDSYRQYAGEALVTLNFSKNILHGLVFSLFFNNWLEAEGSRTVFIAIGGIQLGCLLTTIPMYIYGKRARMWTVRKNLVEKI